LHVGNVALSTSVTNPIAVRESGLSAAYLRRIAYCCPRGGQQ
jgi:hypothetical protein